jgi:hypothetical protein
MTVPEARNVASSKQPLRMTTYRVDTNTNTVYSIPSKEYPHEKALEYPRTSEWKETFINLLIGFISIGAIVLLGMLQKW